MFPIKVKNYIRICTTEGNALIDQDDISCIVENPGQLVGGRYMGSYTMIYMKSFKKVFEVSESLDEIVRKMGGKVDAGSGA